MTRQACSRHGVESCNEAASVRGDGRLFVIRMRTRGLLSAAMFMPEVDAGTRWDSKTAAERVGRITAWARVLRRVVPLNVSVKSEPAVTRNPGLFARWFEPTQGGSGLSDGSSLPPYPAMSLSETGNPVQPV